MKKNELIRGTLYREDLEAIEKLRGKDWRIVVYGNSFVHSVVPSLIKNDYADPNVARVAIEALEYGYILGRDAEEKYPESVAVVCSEKSMYAFTHAKDYKNEAEKSRIDEIAEEAADIQIERCGIVGGSWDRTALVLSYKSAILRDREERGGK